MPTKKAWSEPEEAQELETKNAPRSNNVINLHSNFGGSFAKSMMPSMFQPEYLEEVHVTVPENLELEEEQAIVVAKAPEPEKPVL